MTFFAKKQHKNGIIYTIWQIGNFVLHCAIMKKHSENKPKGDHGKAFRAGVGRSGKPLTYAVLIGRSNG